MIILLMGVSGCGKTTVGVDLAAYLGWEYQEGDALHPPENILKMSDGIPLNDDDRNHGSPKCRIGLILTAWLVEMVLSVARHSKNPTVR